MCCQLWNKHTGTLADFISSRFLHQRVLDFPRFVFINSPGPSWTRSVSLQLGVNLAFISNVTRKDVFFSLLLVEWRERGWAAASTADQPNTHQSLCHRGSVTQSRSTLQWRFTLENRAPPSVNKGHLAFEVTDLPFGMRTVRARKGRNLPVVTKLEKWWRLDLPAGKGTQALQEPTPGVQAQLAHSPSGSDAFILQTSWLELLFTSISDLPWSIFDCQSLTLILLLNWNRISIFFFPYVGSLKICSLLGYSPSLHCSRLTTFPQTFQTLLSFLLPMCSRLSVITFKTSCLEWTTIFQTVIWSVSLEISGTIWLTLCAHFKFTHSWVLFCLWLCKHKPLFIFIYSTVDVLTFSFLKRFKMTFQNIIWQYIKILVKETIRGIVQIGKIERAKSYNGR